MNNRVKSDSVNSVYQVRFEPSVELAAAEDAMLLAILSVACLHGDAAVRLEARYAVDPASRSVVVDATTQIGRYILRVFTGLCARQFGESGFRVVRPSAGRRPMPKAPVTRPVPPNRPHPRKRHALVSGAD